MYNLLYFSKGDVNSVVQICDLFEQCKSFFFCPKAALEALDGLDLFGPEGGHSSVIHILPDDIQQCKVSTDKYICLGLIKVS